MPSFHLPTDDNAPITWHQPPPRRRCSSAFWKTDLAQRALASVGDQRRRGRACGMSDQALDAWVTSLVRQTWPDSRVRVRIAGELAPEVPSWWLGPAEADRLIAKALRVRSMRVAHASAQGQSHAAVARDQESRLGLCAGYLPSNISRSQASMSPIRSSRTSGAMYRASTPGSNA
jgi:hypothetical protein